jgi:hypothetical protein
MLTESGGWPQVLVSPHPITARNSHVDDAGGTQLLLTGFRGEFATLGDS